MIVEKLEDLDKCEQNEALLIQIDLDTVNHENMYEVYHKILGKLRMGGTLVLYGTSFTLFAKAVLNKSIEKTNLNFIISKAKSFHELKEIELLMRQELKIENIYIDNVTFHIEGVR